MFKIAALKNIRNLFPDEHHPFYCGFGNRDTDAVSYRAVGIDLGRIFIINHDGEIHHYNSTYKKSYPLLTELVDDMFPDLDKVIENIVEAAEHIPSSVDIPKIHSPVSPAPKPEQM
jgi:phosphatidate phosphatase PAH1